jgi:hypothetical protein
MIGLCLAIATSIVASLPVERFTLQWEHSIEKVQWQEDWRVDSESRRFVLIESRLRGSGAGMEPPEDAVLRNGIWHAPGRLSVQTLNLTTSGYTADWQLCTNGQCQALLAFTRGLTRRDLAARSQLLSRNGASPPSRNSTSAASHNSASPPSVTLLPCRTASRP